MWVIAAVVWCVAVFSVGLLQNKNASWFPADSQAVHVKISDTITWDYPAEWGVQRIRDDLQKRLAAEDAKDREWATHLPASVKEKCSAIPLKTPFADQPADGVRLFFSKDSRAVPSGWESQIETAPGCKNGASSCEPWERDWGKGSMSGWRVIAVATPWAIAPPLVVLALGASLFWAFAGFRRGSR